MPVKSLFGTQRRDRPGGEARGDYADVLPGACLGVLFMRAWRVYLLQGTILTSSHDKLQRHHVSTLSITGIDPQRRCQSRHPESLIQVRGAWLAAARRSGCRRPLRRSFPADPLPRACYLQRVIGRTPERRDGPRRPQASGSGASLRARGFSSISSVLHEDRVTGMRHCRAISASRSSVRFHGDSVDARHATPTRLSFDLLERLAQEILAEVPGVVSVTLQHRHEATPPPSKRSDFTRRPGLGLPALLSPYLPPSDARGSIAPLWHAGLAQERALRAPDEKPLLGWPHGAFRPVSSPRNGHPEGAAQMKTLLHLLCRSWP